MKLFHVIVLYVHRNMQNKLAIFFIHYVQFYSYTLKIGIKIQHIYRKYKIYENLYYNTWILR